MDEDEDVDVEDRGLEGDEGQEEDKVEDEVDWFIEGERRFELDACNPGRNMVGWGCE